MNLPILTQQNNEELLRLCAVCVSDRSGGQIALFIIISALILLGVANWAWKKHFSNKKQSSQQK